MKKESRNFGRQEMLAYFALSIILSLLFSACGQNAAAKKSDALPAFDEAKNNDFIPRRYLRTTPLAAILNVSTYEEKEVSFQVDKEKDLHVYGVGEAGVGYMDISQNYLFKSDDIEFYFDFSNCNSDVIANQEGHFAYNFSWLDGTVKSNRISFSKQGADYYCYYDTLAKDYIAEIRFPWKTFNMNIMARDTTIRFDIAVGDNDDGLMQTGKLIWHSPSDDLLSTTQGYGNLKLTQNSPNTISPDTIFSVFAHVKIDGIVESLWNSLPAFSLSHAVLGVDDPADLSATVKTCWDRENLYFLMTTHDQSKKQVKSKGIRNLRTLSDYGWIENGKGIRVWEMHIKDAIYAGGARKNIKVDQMVHLRPGIYKLKYFSDESHAWGNWDDEPPKTPFYGIVIYQGK